MDSGTRTGEPRNDVSALRSTKPVGQWLWQQQWSKARGYGIAALAVTVAILVKSALQPWIDRESPFLLFLAAVMVSAWHGGAGPGVFASVLAALASDYFFLAPYGSFGDWNRIQALRLGQFLLEGTVISLLAGGLRHARLAAEKAAAGERSAREEADSARAELAAAYEKEHYIAEMLQRSLLPTIREQTLPGLTIAASYEPAFHQTLVGGDFFDTFSLPDGRVALVVGDVSGKGVGAAAWAGQTKYALRALLHEQTDPVQTVVRLNRFCCHWRCEHPDQASGEGARFVALQLAVIEPASGQITFVVAGAEPPMVLRAGRAGTDVITKGGLPLGVDPGAEYAPITMHLLLGDTVLMTTDGITEARRGKLFLDYEGLVALAQEAATLPTLAAMGRAISDGAHAFAGGTLHDDACLLLARRA